MNQRTTYTSEFKIKVVMESFQRDMTIEAVKRKYGLNGNVVHRWRNEFKEKAARIFEDKRSPKARAKAQSYEPGESPEDLKKIIGDLTIQNEILKKAQKLLS